MAATSSRRTSLTRRRSFASSRTPRATTRRSSRAAAAPSSVVAGSGTMVRSVASTSRSFIAAILHPSFQQLDEVHRTSCDADSGLLERFDLFRRRPRGSGDDGSRVSHAPAWWRGLSCYETDDGFRHVLRDELRRLLLIAATDLTHHRNRARVGILLERREAVDEIGAVDRVAADADARALPHAGARQLVDDLVRQRPGAAHDTNVAWRADTAGNDADLALARRDETGTVRAQEAGALLLHEGIHSRHVQHRHALGDAGDEPDAGAGGFHHRVPPEHRGHVNDGRIRIGGTHRVRHGVEDLHRSAKGLTAFPGRHAANDLRAVLDHLLRVKAAIAARDALHDDRRGLVDEDAHAAFPPCASATACLTASSMSDDAVNPLSCRIFMASSSFVPVRRMTSGMRSGLAFVAVTMPLATSSVRVMPPKMLKRMAFTLGSSVMIRRALTTFSGSDDPPMSRKLAGSPP